MNPIFPKGYSTSKLDLTHDKNNEKQEKYKQTDSNLPDKRYLCDRPRYSQMYFSFLPSVLCCLLLILHQSDVCQGYVSRSWQPRIRLQRAALNKVMIEMPKQTDLSQYERMVEEKIEAKRIIRWYVARLLDEKAMVEVVYDDSAIVYIPSSTKDPE
jgi:hypothetical protein